MASGRKYTGTLSIIFLCGLWLLGCQDAEPSIGNSVLDPQCEESGTLEQGTVEETSRGYGYIYVIYLPPCYGTDKEQEYPLLYLLPGRGSGPESWFTAGANDVADEMILDGTVPPFLIVSTETISSDPLAETIFTELIPHIESNYRVKSDRRFRSVAGGSLGSVGAYRLLFQHPDQFASAGMFGGGLINGEEPRIQEWLNMIPTDHRPRVFLNTGEQDPLMLEQARVMIEVLDTKQIEHEEVFTPGEHTYGYWVSNFPTYFEWLAQDWQ